MGDSARMTAIKDLLMTLSHSEAIVLIENQVYAQGATFTTAEKCVLLELLSQCYNIDDDKAFEALSQCIELQTTRSAYEFKYPESFFILGAGFYRKGMLIQARFVFDQALSRDDLVPELREMIQAFIIQIQEDQKADELARWERGQELIKSEEKLKKESEDKMRRIKEKKKEHEEKAKRAMEENIKKVGESFGDMGSGEDVGTSNPALPEWQSQEFSASFTVFLNSKVGERCYMGILQSESSKLPKSFVEASSFQIDNCEELVSLGRTHESLLNVEHSIVHPIDKSKKLLVTEVIYPVYEFFSLEYQKFKSDPSNKDVMWWDHISGIYWSIFRDVSRGLMFLYEKNKHVCGDLTFNTFVTMEGRGRILPSLDMSKKGEDDVIQLIHLMKSIVNLPFEGKPNTSVLPSDLRRLLDFIPNYLNLPSIFLVDHPFFWTVGEKIDFALKFKKFIKKDEANTIGVQSGMFSQNVFADWWLVLDGVYQRVWKAAQAKKGIIAPYKEEVDIARFFNAAYNHVNDERYKKYRVNNKKWTDKEIERDLVAYFPDYYVTVFECLCVSLRDNQLYMENLKEVSSIYFRDDHR